MPEHFAARESGPQGPALDRRAALAGLAALLAAPRATAAEDAFAARCRALSGFDPIPRALLEPLRAALGEDAGDDALIEALFTGVIPGLETGDGPERVAYPQALLWAAVEDWVNVPSFCGGLPGYWAEPPEVV